MITDTVKMTTYYDRLSAIVRLVRSRGRDEGCVGYEIEVGTRCALDLYRSGNSVFRAVRGGMRYAANLKERRTAHTHRAMQSAARLAAAYLAEAAAPVYLRTYPTDGRLLALVSTARDHAYGLIGYRELTEAHGIAERVFGDAVRRATKCRGDLRSQLRAIDAAESVMHLLEMTVDVPKVRRCAFEALRISR